MNALREQVGRDGPGIGVDAGRQVQPVAGLAAKCRDGFSEIAAVFHARLLPQGRRRCERGFSLGLLLLLAGLTTAASAQLAKIASINVCTDQMLMALADPDQIAGLSPYSRDPARSWMAAEASRYPRLSGEAEDILVLRPTTVVAGRFTRRATRELLRDKGYSVVEFDAARSIQEVREQLTRMGGVVGHPERAAAAIGRIDAAIARAKESFARKPLTVLAVSRRGWVTGSTSLTTSMLSELGLSNLAGKLGKRLGGFVPLETIVDAKPDLILLSEDDPFAEDQGRAFLLHPALEQMYPASKRIVLPERLTVCGGAMLADAFERLAHEIERVGRTP